MNSNTLRVLVLSLFLVSVCAAFTPSENGNGVRWESASSETWSGSTQTSSEGVTLQLAGAFDKSVDTVNGNGVTGYLGLLDPILELVVCVGIDFNLDGINGIDAHDLLLLYVAIIDGSGNPYDLDCNGVTDILDLIQFSQHWKAEN